MPIDVIKERFSRFGYPREGFFRVICSEIIEGNVWSEEDYETFQKAKEEADHSVSGSDGSHIYCAGVYNSSGHELYVAPWSETGKGVVENKKD